MPISLKDLLQKQFPPENHLVGSGLLDYNSLFFIGGPPKTFKSFLVVTLATQLATGTPLFLATRKDKHSKEVPAFPVRKQCKVLLIEQEVGEMDMQTRLGSVLAGMGEGDRTLCEANIFTHSCDHTARLDMLSGRDYIGKMVEDIKPDVVIFDPLKEFHYLDENSSKDMAIVMGNVDWLREKFGFASIIIHHTKKENKQDSTEGPDLLRGSSYIFQKGDSYMMVKRASRKNGVINATFTLRRGKPVSPMTLALDPNTLCMNFAKWNTGIDATEDVLDLLDRRPSVQ